MILTYGSNPLSMILAPCNMTFRIKLILVKKLTSTPKIYRKRILGSSFSGNLDLVAADCLRRFPTGVTAIEARHQAPLELWPLRSTSFCCYKWKDCMLCLNCLTLSGVYFNQIFLGKKSGTTSTWGWKQEFFFLTFFKVKGLLPDACSTFTYLHT